MNKLELFLNNVEERVSKYYLVIFDEKEKDYSQEIKTTLVLADLEQDIPKIFLDYYEHYEEINNSLPLLTVPRILYIEIINSKRVVKVDLKLVKTSV